MIIQGVISSKMVRDVNTKFGIKQAIKITVNGEQIDVGFNKCAFNEGDTVRVDVEEPRGQYGWKPRSITGASGSDPVPAAAMRPPEFLPVHLNRDRCIIRQNALTNAVSYSKGGEYDVEAILEVARAFEEYTTGDGDYEAMKAAAAEMS